MTETSMSVPEDEAVDQWLAAQQEHLARGLTDVLDVEAGLREVLIYVRHDDLVQDLGRTLDIKGGLAAILPLSTSTGAGEKPAPVDAGSAIDRQDLHLRIVALDPQRRLSLRHHPVVFARIVAALLVRTLVLTLDLDHGLDFNRAPGLTRGLDFNLAPDLTRDLTRAPADDRDLDPARARARDLADALAHARARPRARTRARARALAGDLAGDLAHILTRVLTRDLARDFPLDLDLDLDLVGGLTPVLTRALVSARDLAGDLGREVGGLLGLDVTEGVELEILYDLLDDFTRTDLSTVDLTGINLEGVRWSEHATRWPTTMDIERLRSDSEETPAGSGIYVVRPGTTATDLLWV